MHAVQKGAGHIPFGILLASITVLRCHFAASEASNPVVNLHPLGRIAADV